MRTVHVQKRLFQRVDLFQLLQHIVKELYSPFKMMHTLNTRTQTADVINIITGGSEKINRVGCRVCSRRLKSSGLWTNPAGTFARGRTGAMNISRCLFNNNKSTFGKQRCITVKFVLLFTSMYDLGLFSLPRQLLGFCVNVPPLPGYEKSLLPPLL
ncbi:unnamed protein product [Callosobruchus maculatus]|uniref:Uncharacterized protein n=1 Tax=Callosobruchus maculatus TaxID=64391 RepID=A0A653C4B5_CALMS|nr:unnamed protein product [Callosobruchus maculatus]